MTQCDLVFVSRKALVVIFATNYSIVFLATFDPA